jgi:hypothetical protein
MEALRMSIENSDSRSVSQDENLRYPRYEAEVLVSHYAVWYFLIVAVTE